MTMLDTFRLDGKVALVTGGAGLYGRQIAEALAEAGARTFVASRARAKLEAQAERWRDAGLDVQARELDQSDERSVLSLLEGLRSEAGGVDILVNNAVTRPMKDWDDSAALFTESMVVNATGVFLMTRAFGDHMAGRGGGSIINVGSTLGNVGPDYTLYEGLDWGIPPDYFFHKGGMINFTRYVAAKLGPANVRCNTISPGGFFNNQDERFVRRYNARTFLGRLANDSDLKGAIAFLASDASAYITGVNLPIDGGYIAR